MGRAYNEIMERVTVTADMRRRILANVRSTDFGPSGSAVHIPALRRYWAAAACAALLLVGAAVLPRYLALWQTEPDLTLTVPQFTEVSSLAELEQTVGFQVEQLQQLPFTVTDTVYTAFGNELAEIKYCGETETAVVRKALGTEDPSGDYTQYGSERVVRVNGTSVTLKGEDGLYFLALWQEGDYSCSVQLSEGADQAAWQQLLLPLC